MPRPKKEDSQGAPQAEEVSTTKPQKEDKKTIEVGVDVLKAIQDKLAKQDQEIGILRKAADKNQLARHTPKDTIGRSVRVATIDGKLVTSWKLLTNIATYRQGEEKVDQRGEFTLEDGETVPFSIEEFRDMIDPVWVDVDLNKTTYKYDEKGNRREMETVVFEWNGEETSLSATFINP